ncbi:head maturation protease, ClpP-related [Peribacillus sp. R9-11]|uniref:head maturation protease, ClpP-related n=1 Tax=Peribacillus sp. R9-11 TaxID=3073271 RepID=UPI002868C037|nr:head maturation protease, ClpP-related [Peribacillus sp. R9-11]WMX57443.1 Clp protease ClpP [Peribacillus sp. R9-11]
MTKNKIKAIEHKFSNQSTDNEHVMTLNGAIGRGGWFYEATSADDVRNALHDVTESTIRIKLNSGGGDVFHGIEIYNYLKDLNKKIIVEVTANAASAASIIAMGADEVIMKTGATMMIHEASTWAEGTKSDIQKTMNALEAIDDSIVSIYQEKTGLSAEEINAFIEAETWFTVEQAVKHGFADSVEVAEEPQVTDPVFTDELINRLAAQITNNLTNKTNDEPFQQPIVAKKQGFIF